MVGPGGSCYVHEPAGMAEPGGKLYVGSDVQEAMRRNLVDAGGAWMSLVENTTQEAIHRKRYASAWWSLANVGGAWWSLVETLCKKRYAGRDTQQPGGCWWKSLVENTMQETLAPARLVICLKQITRRARERLFLAWCFPPGSSTNIHQVVVHLFLHIGVCITFSLGFTMLHQHLPRPTRHLHIAFYASLPV